MGFKSRFAKLLNARAYSQFVRACQNPERAYQELWKEIYREISPSPFWQSRRASANLESYEVTEYGDYIDALERSFKQKNSELNGQEILFWCESSGTTGKRKVFPISENYLEQIQRTTKPFSYLVCQKFPKFLENPLIYFAATQPLERSPAGIEVGFISNFVYRRMPRLIRKSYAFPSELYQSSDLFYEWGPLYALAQDMCGLFAITPSMIVQFATRIENNRDRFLEILAEPSRWPQNLPRVEVSRERLALLQQALAKKQICFSEIWPSMQLITTWKASTCGLQLRELDRFLDAKILVTDGQYSATEGWMTVPMIDSRVGSVLHPSAILVEFVEHGQTVCRENILQPWQLTPGKDYEVLLTQKMGFVRYRLHDVVRCNGFWYRSPILEFRFKAGNILSLGQSRFSEIHLLEAMQESGLSPRGRWIFAPSSGGDQLILYVADEAMKDGAARRNIEANATVLGEKNTYEEQQKLELFNRVLGRLNPEIQSDYDSGLLRPVEIKLLSVEHPIWTKNTHAQAKQKTLSKEPLLNCC